LKNNPQPDLEKYLEELVEVPTGARTMGKIIQFNIENADKELVPPYYTDQSRYVQTCMNTEHLLILHFRMIEAKDLTKDDEYYQLILDIRKMAGKDGIDAVLEKYNLDALVLPTERQCFPSYICASDLT
jgi:amidase